MRWWRLPWCWLSSPLLEKTILIRSELVRRRLLPAKPRELACFPGVELGKQRRTAPCLAQS
jgi:hypothetical protein